MEKLHIFVVIGILAAVLLAVNYMVMQPIAQKQYEELEQMLPAYGLTGGSLSDYGTIEKAMGEGGLQFSYEWYNIYEAYRTTHNEIIIVSILCIIVSIASFSIFLYIRNR